MSVNRKTVTKTKKTTLPKKKTLSKKTSEQDVSPTPEISLSETSTKATDNSSQESSLKTPSVESYVSAGEQAESPVLTNESLASMVTEKPSQPVGAPETKLEQPTPVAIEPNQSLSTSPSVATYPQMSPSKTDISEPATEETHSTKWIVIIVVLGLLIISIAGGAFYYLTQYKYAPKEILSPQPVETVPSPTTSVDQKDSQTTELKKVSQSDQVDDILTDIENTNLENLDQELTKIGKEL